MKKFTWSLISIVGVALFIGSPVFAQGMMGNSTTDSDGHTAREEAEGKAVWEKLSRSADRGSSTESGQAKQVACADISDADFEKLGEYFMGTMMGASHEAMNTMMVQMIGEQGEEQVHIVMGKRLSGCDTQVAFPSQGVGFMPMMQMMIGGGWSSHSGLNQGNNSMMNFGFTPFGFFGWLVIILWWALIIVAIVALVKWLANQFKGAGSAGKSALDILKERYARGEVDRKEFEEKSREIKNS